MVISASALEVSAASMRISLTLKPECFKGPIIGVWRCFPRDKARLIVTVFGAVGEVRA